jgi:hypothetical protein
MSYSVKNTQGKLVAVVEDGTLNTDTSLSLVGIGRNDYSETIAEDFIRLMENFCSIYEPTNPVQGQLYFDNSTDVNRLKVFDGSRFAPINNVTVTTTAPPLPQSGDLWYDKTNQQLKFYNPAYSGWTVITPPYTESQGETGLIVDTLYDLSRNPYTVNRIMVNGVYVAIIANDTFQPFPSILGFDTLTPGINLINTGVIKGTVDNSLHLNGRLPNSFMYSNSDTSTTGVLSILNNHGLAVGNTGAFIANISPGAHYDVNLINTSASGVINLTTTDSANHPVNTLQVTPGGDINVLNDVYASAGIFSNVSVLNELDVDNNINLTGDLNLQGMGNINASGNVNISSNLYIAGSIFSLAQSTSTLNTVSVNVSGTSTIGTVVTNSNTQMATSGTGTLLGTGGYVGELPTKSVFYGGRNITVTPGASLAKGTNSITVNETAIYAQGNVLTTGNFAVGTGSVDLGTLQLQGITGTPAPGSSSTLTSSIPLYLNGTPLVRTNQLSNDTNISTQTLNVADTTDTTGVNTGSLQISGGASINKSLFVAGNTSLGRTNLNGVVTEKINYQRIAPGSPALQGTETLNLINGPNFIYSGGTAGSWSPNFVWNTGVSLNSQFVAQQSFTVNIIVQQRNVSYNTSSVFIDGAAQTVYWLGYVPTVASINSIDSYNYFIIKQSENNWLVLASTSNFVSS